MVSHTTLDNNNIQHSYCLLVRLYRYQVGNTSSSKTTEVKQLGPWFSAWMGDRSSVEVNAVVNNTVKSQKRRTKPQKHNSGAKTKFRYNTGTGIRQGTRQSCTSDPNYFTA